MGVQALLQRFQKLRESLESRTGAYFRRKSSLVRPAPTEPDSGRDGHDVTSEDDDLFMEMDFSFLRRYQRYFERASENNPPVVPGTDELLDEILVDQDFPPNLTAVHIITLHYASCIMEHFGFLLLNTVITNVVHYVDSDSEDEPEPKNLQKIIVFVDDRLDEDASVSCSLGQLLTIGLLACGVETFVVPGFDLNAEIIPVVAKNTFGLKDLDSDWNRTYVYNEIIKCGFVVGTTHPVKDVVLIDAFWKYVDYQDLIERINVMGHRVVLAQLWKDGSRLTLIRSIIKDVKTILQEIRPDRENGDTAELGPTPSTTSIETMTDFINETSDYPFDFETCESTEEYQSVSEPEPAGSELGIPEIRIFSPEWKLLGQDQDGLPREEAKGKKGAKPAYRFRLFQHQPFRALGTFLRKIRLRAVRRTKPMELKPKTEVPVPVPEIPVPAPAIPVPAPATVVPRLSNEEFERIFVQPKVYAAETRRKEALIFHSEQDMEELDKLFDNCMVESD